MKLGGESKIVLREKAKAVVVRCALSVAGIRLGGEVRSQVQVGQSCHRRIIAILKPSGTDRVAIGPETARTELEQTARQIVIEVLDRDSPVFPAKLDGVAAAQPGNVAPGIS